MNSLYIESFSIMAIGMGVVFSFLITTIFSMIIMSKVVGILNKIFPEASAQPVSVKKVAKVSDESEIALAIAVASAQK